MSGIGFSPEELRRDFVDEADDINSPLKSRERDKKQKGIFGLAKNSTKATQCLAGTEKVEFELGLLNREIAEAGKSDFYKAFLRENMFQTIRKEITEYQGR